jgi:hypothetical protein
MQMRSLHGAPPPFFCLSLFSSLLRQDTHTTGTKQRAETKVDTHERERKREKKRERRGKKQSMTLEEESFFSLYV